MGYINTGVRDAQTNSAVPTKTALRRSLSQDPTSVVFYSTSDFTPFQGTAQDIQLGDILSVCGPNPYSDRRWYTNITKDADDNIIMDGKKIKPATS